MSNKVIPFRKRAEPKPAMDPFKDVTLTPDFVTERMGFVASILQGYGRAFHKNWNQTSLPELSTLNVFHMADMMIEWRMVLRQNQAADAKAFLDARLKDHTVSDVFRQVMINSMEEIRKGFNS